MIGFPTETPLFETTDAMLAGGLRLRYTSGGPVAGPAVLLLHGMTDSSFSFSRVLPLLPPHVRFVAPDQRGHGDSDRPARGYAVEDFASDALQLLDLLEIDRVTIVGHSMGSFIARRVAERAPARVVRLVLVGASLTCRTPAVQEFAAAAASLTDPIDPAFVREFQASTIHAPVPPGFFERVVQESLKVPARVWRQAVQGLTDWEPRWPITCPTRILGGELDTIFDRDAQAALFHRTERATFHLEPGIGHALHWEAPERFAELAFAGL